MEETRQPEEPASSGPSGEPSTFRAATATAFIGAKEEWIPSVEDFVRSSADVQRILDYNSSLIIEWLSLHSIGKAAPVSFQHPELTHIMTQLSRNITFLSRLVDHQAMLLSDSVEANLGQAQRRQPGLPV